MLMKEWLKVWQSSAINVKDRTNEIYNYYFTNHILKEFENVEIENINEDILQKYIINLVKGEKLYATSTIHETFRILKTCLINYYEKYDIKPIKFKNIKLPQTQEKKVECFSEKDQQKLQIQMGLYQKPNQIGIVITLYTGLRLGELLALRWKNIDFNKNLIYINQSVYYKNKELRFTTPKTKSSIRTIPIPFFLVKLLKEHRRKSNSEFVISDKYGQAVIPRTYQYEFAILLKKCNIEHKGFHSLRHTFATRAIECGMDIKSLADILGHSNPMITLKRYAHSMLDYKKTMMNKIGKLYFRQ